MPGVQPFVWGLRPKPSTISLNPDTRIWLLRNRLDDKFRILHWRLKACVGGTSLRRSKPSSRSHSRRKQDRFSGSLRPIAPSALRTWRELACEAFEGSTTAPMQSTCAILRASQVVGGSTFRRSYADVRVFKTLTRTRAACRLSRPFDCRPVTSLLPGKTDSC